MVSCQGAHKNPLLISFWSTISQRLDNTQITLIKLAVPDSPSRAQFLIFVWLPVSDLYYVQEGDLHPDLHVALCSLSVRGVSSLTWTAPCGTLNNRSSALSMSRCGTFTTTASSSRLEKDGTPSSWRRSRPCATTRSPLRRGCLTWRYVDRYGQSGSVDKFQVGSNTSIKRTFCNPQWITLAYTLFYFF